MTAHLLLAPPASGKTTYCITAIQGIRAQNPLAPIWVLVPGRLQAASFRRRLAEAGGALGVRIETFANLFQEAVERAAAPLYPKADPVLKLAVMQAAVQSTALDYLAPLKPLPGFARTLLERIADLQHALVAPDQLQEETASPTVGGIGQVFQTYRELLRQIGWMDPDQLPGMAIRLLESSPALFTDLSLLVVDGFDRFDPAQRRVLALLAPRVGRLLITLPGEPSFGRAAHRRFHRTCDDLDAAFRFDTITIDTPPRLPGALAALEAGLQEIHPPAVPDSTNEVDLIEARTPADEAREALRWVKQRIVRDRVHPSRCAMLVPDLDLYRPFLRRTAAEFGLLLRFPQRQPLADYPVIAALLNLLSLPRTRYPRRALLDALRSPFFRLAPLGIGRGEAAVLDLVSRYGKVIEGLGQWAEVFASLAALPVENTAVLEPDDEGPPPPHLPRGEEAARLQDKFAHLTARLIPPDGQHPVREWVVWLEGLLGELGFYPSRAKESDEDTGAALLAFRDTLQGMLAVEAALAPLGEQELDYNGFAGRLETLLQGSGVEDAGRSIGQEVLVLRLVEARSLRFEAVAVLGLAEGTFPQVERPDPLLDEETRLRLGMPSRLEQEQLGIFYQAVTRADRALLLTRPYLADTGDPWEASPYWSEAARLFPGRVRRLRPEDPRPLAEAASSEEALFWAARRHKAVDPGFAALAGRWARIQIAQIRLSGLLQAEADPVPDPALAALVAGRYGAEKTWSVSRLETFTACPYRFFLETYLGAEAHEPPEWDLDAAQSGSLLHAVLERIYKEAANPADLEELAARLPHVAQEEFARAPARFGFRPSVLWTQMQDELLDRLRETLVGLAELDPGPGWQPAAFELRFGFERPFAIQVGGQPIRLHGVIDRVDRNRAGTLRVIDYKTGGGHLGRQDLFSGRKLQLPLYALAAQDVLGAEVVDGLYYRIGRDGANGMARLQKMGGRENPDGIGVAVGVSLGHLEDIFDRLSQGDFASQPLGGKCASYCAAAPWCWHYHPEWTGS